MKNKIIGGVAILALVVSVLGLFRTPVQQVIEKVTNTNVGNAGPDEDNPYRRVAGVETFTQSLPMTATSTYLCTFRNPFNATSTINSFSALVTANPVGGVTVDLSTTTSGSSVLATNGSSTPALVSAYTLTSAYTQGFLVWNPAATTTIGRLNGGVVASGVLGQDIGPTGASNIILRANESVNLRIATGTPLAFSSYLSGTCTISIRKL